MKESIHERNCTLHDYDGTLYSKQKHYTIIIKYRTDKYSLPEKKKHENGTQSQ